MILVLALAGYLAFWPVPIEPVSWHAPAAASLAGPYAENDKLASAKTVRLSGDVGPENVTMGPDGKIYMGVVHGHILRMAPDGTSLEVFADTGGRPVGLAFDANGSLIVADAFKGLLSITAEGRQTVLVRASADAEVTFPNAVTVATNGKIYFTDSSRRFPPERWGTTQEAAMLEILEQSASGRVMEYDPQSARVRVVADRLCLANGVVMSGDETHLLVSESGRYRVWQIPIAANRLNMSTQPGVARVLLDNLPGYPDNLTRGLNGKIWLGLAGQRNMLDRVAEHPFLRQMILRIPRFMWSMPRPLGHVIAFTEDGHIVADLQDATGHSPSTTGATETADRLYIQNVDGNSLSWLPLQQAQTTARP